VKLRRLSETEVARHPHVPEVDRSRARILVVPTWVPGVGATTFGHLVVVRSGREGDRRLLAHELVHIRQWRELGLLGFLVQYLGEYLDGRGRGLSHRDAYEHITLEQEARTLAEVAMSG
jgi:hypothetical protein